MTPEPTYGTRAIGDAETIVETAQAAAKPERLDTADVYSVVVPQGGRVELLDLERFEVWPRRARGNVAIATVDSLKDYVSRHDDPDHTTIWVHPATGKVVAVLNDHGGSHAEWGDHRATLTLLRTPEWDRWIGRDGALVDQEQFAEHIEDGLAEIVEPAAATLLEVAQTFHATTSAQFRQATRLTSGEVQMRYDEEVEASAGRSGDLTVPSEFVLALAPFVGEEPYRVAARLRYRVAGGNLRLGYRLDRPDRVVRDAIENIAGRLREAFGAERVFLGEPRA